MEKYKILIGQKVYSVTKGELVIINIVDDSDHPIYVGDSKGSFRTFTIDGKFHKTHIRPELSRYEPKVNEDGSVCYISINFDEWIEELEGEKKLVEAGYAITSNSIAKNEYAAIHANKLERIRAALEHLKQSKRVKGKRYLVCDDLLDSPRVYMFVQTNKKNHHCVKSCVESEYTSTWNYCIPHEFYDFNTGKWLPGHEDWLD